jgi:hypothetical protein
MGFFLWEEGHLVEEPQERRRLRRSPRKGGGCVHQGGSDMNTKTHPEESHFHFFDS